MKLLVFGDVHFCTNSSIINTRGQLFSKRLDNCINSVNWALELASIHDVDEVICTGDFFNTSSLSADELTALKAIRWSATMPISFVVGNHEMVRATCESSSLNALFKMGQVIDTVKQVEYDDFYLVYMPYMTENSRKPFGELFDERKEGKKTIVISHNDIAGIQYGPTISKIGFDVSDIEHNCDLFLNGHLHNGMRIGKTIINVGNLTGQNFSEDASKYSHGAYIVDTDTLDCQFIENPYAFNFYSFAVTSETDIRKLDNLKGNSVVYVKCDEALVSKVKLELESNETVIASKVITNIAQTELVDVKSISNIDYKQLFMQCCEEAIGKTDLVYSELSEVLK